METIKYIPHGDSCITVTETTDYNYAHDCFDGSEQEWVEIVESARESNPPRFYIVSTGLQGCYMADNVSVFGNEKEALGSAEWWKETWEDEDSEREEN